MVESSTIVKGLDFKFGSKIRTLYNSKTGFRLMANLYNFRPLIKQYLENWTDCMFGFQMAFEYRAGFCMFLNSNSQGVSISKFLLHGRVAENNTLPYFDRGSVAVWPLITIQIDKYEIRLANYYRIANC